MAPWVLFSILAFLVFGVPLIDEVYRLRARRAATQAQAVQEHVSLVPDDSEENRLVSSEVAPSKKAPEDVA
jgi:hypothetical protein